MGKILILTARTGGGHMVVAKSLNHYLSNRGHETKIYDIINNSSELLDNVIVYSNAFLFANAPNTYQMLYYLSSNKIFNDIVIKRTLSKVCRKEFQRVCDEFEPDVIVATHAFHIPIITVNKQHIAKKYKIISVITDYKYHIGYLSKKVDAYIVGSLYSKKELIKTGINKKKIYDYGIPINKNFFEKQPKKKEVKLKHILISGGSSGMSNMKNVLKSLQLSKENFEVSVICGSNKKLQEKLEKLTENDKRIKIYGFVDNMHEFMSKADVLIAKPGGLTISESIVKKLPIIIPYRSSAQEKDNKEFLLKNELAIHAKDTKQVKQIVEDLIINPEKLEKMSNNMMKMSKKYSIEKTIELIEQKIDE